jgi:hypothetical protein
MYASIIILCSFLLQPISVKSPKIQMKPNWVQSILIYFEIVDYREYKYIFGNMKSLGDDLTTIKNRLSTMGDAPYIKEAEYFPDRLIINEFLVFNRTYHNYLNNQFKLFHGTPHLRQFYEAVIEDNQFYYQIWDACRDAKCDYYYIHVRRQGLKKLKQELMKIDPLMWKAKQLPDFVPNYSFHKIK